MRKLLVDRLKSEGIVKSRDVEKALLSVPREAFVPKGSTRDAYHDRPLSIGKGQTISAPHMVAIMAENLDLKKGHKILEIGGGSGYHAAVISRIIGEEGRVISVEVVPELAERARKALASAGIDNVTMITGDGSRGFPEEAPYDRIYYTCAAPYVPEIMFEQLKVGGLLMSVEGDPYSTQRLIGYGKKEDGTFDKEVLSYCVFVPLVGEYGHRS